MGEVSTTEITIEIEISNPMVILMAAPNLLASHLVQNRQILLHLLNPPAFKRIHRIHILEEIVGVPIVGDLNIASLNTINVIFIINNSTHYAYFNDLHSL